MSERNTDYPNYVRAHIYTEIAGYCFFNVLLKSVQYIKIPYNVDVQGR